MPDKEKKLVCTCDDEFKTHPCPVHYDQEVQGKYTNIIIVSDGDLVPEKIRQWAGYCFVCPKCGEPAIMDMMRHCGNCGVEVRIKSRVVTAFVNRLMGKNSKPKEGDA